MAYMAPYADPACSFQEVIDGFPVHFSIAVHLPPGGNHDHASLLVREIGQAVHKTVTDLKATTSSDPPITIFLRDGAQCYPFAVRRTHDLQEPLRRFAAMAGTIGRPVLLKCEELGGIDADVSVGESGLREGMIVDVWVIELQSYTDLFGRRDSPAHGQY